MPEQTQGGALVRLFIALMAVIFVAALATLLAGYLWLMQPTHNQSEHTIEISRGDTLYGLAQQWQDDGWLPSALALRLAARLNGTGGDIRVGEYSVPPELSVFELLSFLATAPAHTYRVTLIEGRPLREALAALASAEHLTQDVQPLTPDTVAQYLGLSGSPEGQLYPDTYVYHRNEPVSSILTQAHERLAKVLAEEWQQRDEGLPYASPDEALVMASIIEKETGVGSERPTIAGVFVRRLQSNMRLETDPTVIYGLGPDFDGNLTRKHLRDRSNPYNTYRNKGLPPGPIALAGRAAIHAALHPAPGKALYFVAKGDGSHHFSETLSEHNKAVREYQLSRRADYRSSPAPSQ